MTEKCFHICIYVYVTVCVCVCVCVYVPVQRWGRVAVLQASVVDGHNLIS